MGQFFSEAGDRTQTNSCGWLNFVMLWCMPMTEPSWRRYASQNHSTSSLIEPLPRPATFSDTNSIISYGAGAGNHTSTGGVPGCQAGRGAVTVCVHTQPIDQPGGLYDQALCCTLSTGARRRADRAQARWSPSGPSRATYATQIHSNRYEMRTFFTGTPIANTSHVMIERPYLTHFRCQGVVQGLAAYQEQLLRPEGENPGESLPGRRESSPLPL